MGPVYICYIFHLSPPHYVALSSFVHIHYATLLFALHINFNERFFARKRISKDFFYYLVYQFHILIAIKSFSL